jgi:hypothetical protein
VLAAADRVEAPFQRRHAVWLGIEAIVTLAGIGAEVVEFAGAGVCRDPFGIAIPGRDLRNAPRRRVEEDPIVLPQGIAVGVGVVNDLAAG